MCEAIEKNINKEFDEINVREWLNKFSWKETCTEVRNNLNSLIEKRI